MLKIVILIAFSVVSLVIAICRPVFLADNTFLMSFVSFEMLNILAVILTVTLASVANIHLWLNRIVRGMFPNNLEAGNRAASRVRSEINQDAWALLWLFIIGCGVLLAKGSIDGHRIGTALAHAAAMIILLANILILYDIYSVIYKLILADGRWSTPKPSVATKEQPLLPQELSDTGEGTRP